MRKNEPHVLLLNIRKRKQQLVNASYEYKFNVN